MKRITWSSKRSEIWVWVCEGLCTSGDENAEELIIALLGSLSLRNLASQTSKSSDSNPVTENNFQKSGRMIYVYNTYQWLSQPFY